MNGFGWNFYGYFVFAVVWIAGYFLWALWMARRPPDPTGPPPAPPESPPRAA